MLLTLLATALACTPNPFFEGFDLDAADVGQIPTDARIPLRANTVTSLELAEDLQAFLDGRGYCLPEDVKGVGGADEPVPDWEYVSDYYDWPPTMLIAPARPLQPDTTYELTARFEGYGGGDLQDTLVFTTGAGEAAPVGEVTIVGIEASALGSQTNDCVVGTHEPRDLVVELDVSAADPLSRVALRNDDLRMWVSQPIDGPGLVTLDVFQPVLDDPDSDRVNCFTAFVVNPAGASSESAEFCLGDDSDTSGCGCSQGGPAGAAGALVGLLALLGRRQRSTTMGGLTIR